MKNIRVVVKLILLIAFMVLSVATVSAISIIELRQVNGATMVVVDDHLPNIVLLGEISAALHSLDVAQKEYIDASSGEEKLMLQDEVSAYRTDLVSYMEALDETFHAVEETADLEGLKSAITEYVSINEQIMALSGEDKSAEANALDKGESEGAIHRIDALISTATKANIIETRAEREQARVTFDNAMALIIGVGVMCDLLGIALGIFIARSMTGSLSQLLSVSKQVAVGELQQEDVEVSKDEIGQLAESFNQMMAALREMVGNEQIAREVLEITVSEYLVFVEQVAQGDLTRRLVLNGNGTGDKGDPLYVLGENLNHMVDSLAQVTSQSQEMGSRLAIAAAEILAATTQQLASTTEQDASVSQTTTTVDEVRATVQQTAERADNVAEASRRSVDIGERGARAVQDSIEGMQLIRERVEGIAENILALSEKTQQIGEIIASVNGIAEQSKMLALNASIEASRAGEEGKGFAVVAMEVRSLAEQSREATDQVRQILNEIQQATNAAVMATEEGSKGVDAGMVQVELAGQVIDELAQVIRESAQSATQIAASTRQQTTGMDQLSAAIDAIRQASVQNQASTKQAEHSAQDLNDMARQLKDVVERYQL